MDPRLELWQLPDCVMRASWGSIQGKADCLVVGRKASPDTVTETLDQAVPDTDPHFSVR